MGDALGLGAHALYTACTRVSSQLSDWREAAEPTGAGALPTRPAGTSWRAMQAPGVARKGSVRRTSAAASCPPGPAGPRRPPSAWPRGTGRLSAHTGQPRGTLCSPGRPEACAVEPANMLQVRPATTTFDQMCSCLTRPTWGQGHLSSSSGAMTWDTPEVGARPEQRLSCLQGAPHGCPVQPCLPCGIDQVWLGPAFQQQADDSHPVVQGPPLQGVVPLGVCLVHLQGQWDPSRGPRMPTTWHS